jgi:hypothetical protein
MCTWERVEGTINDGGEVPVHQKLEAGLVNVPKKSQLVVVGIQGWDFGLETLSYPNAPDQLLDLAALIERGSIHHLPVIEHILWEGLTGGS